MRSRSAAFLMTATRVFGRGARGRPSGGGGPLSSCLQLRIPPAFVNLELMRPGSEAEHSSAKAALVVERLSKGTSTRRRRLRRSCRTRALPGPEAQSLPPLQFFARKAHGDFDFVADNVARRRAFSPAARTAEHQTRDGQFPASRSSDDVRPGGWRSAYGIFMEIRQKITFSHLEKAACFSCISLYIYYSPRFGSGKRMNAEREAPDMKKPTVIKRRLSFASPGSSLRFSSSAWTGTSPWRISGDRGAVRRLLRGTSRAHCRRLHAGIRRVTALSLPGAALMTLAGGALFGFAVGLVAVSFASTVGASCLPGVALHFTGLGREEDGGQAPIVRDGFRSRRSGVPLHAPAYSRDPLLGHKLLMGLTRMSSSRFIGSPRSGCSRAPRST